MVTVEGVRLAAAITVRKIGEKPDSETTAFDVVQVSVASLQVQPAPLIAVAEKPVGKVSVTVTKPDVVANAGLVTAIV